MTLKKRAFPWWLPPCGGALVILASAWRIDTSGSIRSFRDWASRTEVMLGKDRFSKRQAMLARLGFLSVSRFYSRPQPLGSDARPARRLFGGPCPEPDAARFDPSVPPSTSLLPSPPPSVPEDTAIVSLVCGAEELFDEHYGIVPNARKRGRNWERPAWATVTLGNETVLEQPVGLRVHGGVSRGGDIKSFRLVFHRRYAGEPHSPPGLFFGPETPPLKSVVLMNGARPKRVVGALMLELAARAGCQTSAVRPAVVYLNGTLIPAPYFLVEHQSLHYLQVRHQLRNIDFHRLKAKTQVESRAYKDFRRRTLSDEPLDMEGVGHLYDLEDLAAWSFMISFAVISDNNQGAYFRDREASGVPWSGLTWDLDGAFNGWEQAEDENGRYDYLSILRGHRGRLSKKLMAESSDYRRQFLRFALEKLRGPFSSEQLEPVLERYERLVATHPGAYPKLEPEVRKVFRQLREQPARYLEYLRRAYPEDFAAVEREEG